MDANILQAFVAVAETGSFSLAADRLLLTQPAVSKRVAALEQELERPLFERLSKGVLLTEAGSVLLPKARLILKEMAGCRQLIADLSGTVSGTLRLATSHHIGLHRLPSYLRRYNQMYPCVEFALQFMDSESGWAAVAEGHLEMAVVTLPRTPVPRLELHRIWDDPLQVMVSRHHPLASGGTVHDLLHYPAIVPEKGSETRRLIDTALEAAGVAFRAGVETNYLETIGMLVAAGLGWSVLPLTMHGSELVCLPMPGIHLHRELGLVTRQGGQPSRAALAFAQLVAAGPPEEMAGTPANQTE